MKIISYLFKRYFKLTIDGYFIFKKELLLDEIYENCSLPESYSIRPIQSLNDKDASDLINFWRNAYHSRMEKSKEEIVNIINQMFSDGDICFGLFYGNTLVGMGWLGLNRAFTRMKFSKCIKSHASAIGHHAFIISKHRGCGLHRYIDLFRKKAALDKGCSRFYIFVGVKNFASIKNMMKCNDQYKLIYHMKVDMPFLEYDIFPGYNLENWNKCISMLTIDKLH